MLRRHKRPDALPAVPRLGRRWQTYINDSLDARARFEHVVSGLRPGPLQDRLAELQVRLQGSITTLWDTATRADEVDRSLLALDPAKITAQYKRARRDVDEAGRSGGDVPAPVRETAALLGEQHAAVQRLLNAVDTADETLATLRLRVDQLVVRAMEVSVQANNLEDVGDLDAQLVDLDDALAALRSGLDAVQ